MLIWSESELRKRRQQSLEKCQIGFETVNRSCTKEGSKASAQFAANPLQDLRLNRWKENEQFEGRRVQTMQIREHDTSPEKK